MFKNVGSNTLLKLLNKLLHLRKLPQDIVNILVILIVTAIVLDGFLMTTFFIILAAFQTLGKL